jgi:hypothetical protein
MAKKKKKWVELVVRVEFDETTSEGKEWEKDPDSFSGDLESSISQWYGISSVDVMFG